MNIKTNTTYGGGCHTGSVLVGTFGGVDFWAGGDSRKGGWWTLKPYPDLAIGPKGHVDRPRFASSRHDLPEGFEHLAQHFGDDANEEPSKVIALDWPDFSVPKDTPPEFWHALRDEIIKQNIQSVYCMCMGGHGRTGISLSILIHLLATPEERQWTDYASLLKWVHDNYCTQAVEGDDQAKYAADACGLELGDVVINHHRGGGGGWGWSSPQVDYTWSHGGTTTNKSTGTTKCYGCGCHKQRAVMENVTASLTKDDIWLCVACFEEAGHPVTRNEYEMWLDKDVEVESLYHTLDKMSPDNIDPRPIMVQCFDCDTVYDTVEYLEQGNCQMCLSTRWSTYDKESKVTKWKNFFPSWEGKNKEE